MKAIYSSLVAVLILAAGACVATEYEAPIRGWTCLPTFGGCDEYGHNNPSTSGTVGLPFNWRLLARCNTGQWDYNTIAIQTGRLPPGLDLVSGSPTLITGVPTRAGSFSFTVKLSGISCPGSNYLPYGDKTDSYTIVITGN